MRFELLIAMLQLIFFRTFREGFIYCISCCRHNTRSTRKQDVQPVAIVDSGITTTTCNNNSGTTSGALGVVLPTDSNGSR